MALDLDTTLHTLHLQLPGRIQCVEHVPNIDIVVPDGTGSQHRLFDVAVLPYGPAISGGSNACPNARASGLSTTSRE